jgi:hypothetical protein
MSGVIAKGSFVIQHLFEQRNSSEFPCLVSMARMTRRARWDMVPGVGVVDIRRGTALASRSTLDCDCDNCCHEI